MENDFVGAAALSLYGNSAPAAPAPTGLPSLAPAPAAPKPAPVAQAAPVAAAQPAEAKPIDLAASLYPDLAKAEADAKAAEAKPADAATADARPAMEVIDQAHWAAPLAAPIIEEMGLTVAQATKLEGLHQKMSEAAIDRQSAAWAAEAAALHPSVIRDAVQAVQLYGSPELSAILTSSGLGNHPRVIEAFARAMRNSNRR